jgi:hypothetical protein
MIAAVIWTLGGVVMVALGLVRPSLYEGVVSGVSPFWFGALAGGSNVAIGLFCIWAFRR